MEKRLYTNYTAAAWETRVHFEESYRIANAQGDIKARKVSKIMNQEEVMDLQRKKIESLQCNLYRLSSFNLCTILAFAPRSSTR